MWSLGFQGEGWRFGKGQGRGWRCGKGWRRRSGERRGRSVERRRRAAWETVPHDWETMCLPGAERRGGGGGARGFGITRTGKECGAGT